jgi:beta-glucosidase
MPRVKSLLAFLTLITTAAMAATPPRPDIPIPCLEKQWSGKHQYLCGLVAQASRHPPLDVYFLGDSITEFWPYDGKAIWQAEFGKLHVLNCGVAGDLTQNILFRITHGEFDHITPRVVVVLAGINNLGGSAELAPADLADGLRQIVLTLRAKSPSSKILLLSIFPAGEPNDPIRARILETNRLLARLDDHAAIRFLDIYSTFLDPKGEFPVSLSPDGVHLSARGFQVWADSMRPTLTKLLESDAN